MSKVMVRAAIVLALCAGAASVQATVCYGDANCDWAVNWRDIDFLIAGMNDNESGWAAAFPGGSPSCEFENLDASLDGAVNWRDIDPFISVMNTPCWVPPDPPSMELIPAGEFTMGDTFGEGGADELPCHAVYTDAFYMGTHEVTNQEYADALNWAWARGTEIGLYGPLVLRYGFNSGQPQTMVTYCLTRDAENLADIIWNGTEFVVEPGRENWPICSVTWHGAVAYANWMSTRLHLPVCYNLSTWTCNFGAGYRLPTEAEWEKAARGGTPGRRFPWSDTDTISQARAAYQCNVDYPYDESEVEDPWGYGWGAAWRGLPSPVGFYSGALQQQADWNWPGTVTSFQTISDENGYGLRVLAGNVWEWCYDWYGADYYTSSPYANPRGPAGGTSHVWRGGAIYSPGCASDCRNASRDAPQFLNALAGFRCVRSAP